jgi:hypothetical protein
MKMMRKTKMTRETEVVRETDLKSKTRDGRGDKEWRGRQRC